MLVLRPDTKPPIRVVVMVMVMVMVMVRFRVRFRIGVRIRVRVRGRNGTAPLYQAFQETVSPNSKRFLLHPRAYSDRFLRLFGT